MICRRQATISNIRRAAPECPLLPGAALVQWKIANYLQPSLARDRGLLRGPRQPRLGDDIRGRGKQLVRHDVLSILDRGQLDLLPDEPMMHAGRRRELRWIIRAPEPNDLACVS